ncbi:MAG: hypothetical protein ABIQ35_00960 [Verrucomicrobiota bacterium]
MTIKNLFLYCSVILSLTAPTLFALPTASFSDGPGTTGGGEFIAQTSADGRFLTFCLEASEPLSYGTIYFYQISQEARYNGTTSTLDPLSRPTAWLYLQFLDETLGSFGSLYAYEHNDSDANDLQRAFWYLEGEEGGLNNYYAQLAVQQAGASTLDNNGFYAVGIMNLWGNENGTGAGQDQLIRLNSVQSSPVPDGGSTLLLSSLAMGSVGLLLGHHPQLPVLSSQAIRGNRR